MICSSCKQEMMNKPLIGKKIEGVFCSRSCFCSFQWKGSERSQETRHKQALAKMGDKNPSKRNDVRKIMSLSAKRRFLNPEEHLKAGNATRGRKLSEEHKKKCSAALKGKTYKQIYGDRAESELKKRLISRFKAPNKFESKCMQYLQKVFPDKFIYTGNGKCIVNGRSADAFSKDLNTVALFNGIHWHLEKYGFKTTTQAKGAIELIESIPFLESGYKVLFIWDDEINAEEFFLYDSNKKCKSKCKRDVSVEI